MRGCKAVYLFANVCVCVCMCKKKKREIRTCVRALMFEFTSQSSLYSSGNIPSGGYEKVTRIRVTGFVSDTSGVV